MEDKKRQKEAKKHQKNSQSVDQTMLNQKSGSSLENYPSSTEDKQQAEAP
jgi:hypothetical protein